MNRQSQSKADQHMAGSDGGNVIQFFLGSEGGGIMTAVIQAARVLQRDGEWSFRFVLLHDDRAAAMLRQAGFPVLILRLGRIKRYTRLAAALRPLHPHLIHVHNPAAHLMAHRAARQLGVPIVRTVHADMFEEMRQILPWWRVRIWRFLMGYCLPRADKVIVVSPHLIALLPGISGASEHLVYGPNGYDAQELLRDAKPLDQELVQWLGDHGSEYGNGSPLVLAMGRLVAVKNYELLLRAWVLVIDRQRNAKLIIAGSGPQEGMLRRLAEDLHIGTSVRFLSWVDHITALLKRCTCVAISSNSECCPMVVLEAMSAGKPIVSTAVGGIPAMVDQDGRGGAILVPPGDAGALADGLIRVITDPEAATRLGAAGHQRLQERFTDIIAAQRIAGWYREVGDV